MRVAAVLCAVFACSCASKTESLRDTLEPPPSELPDASTPAGEGGAAGSTDADATDGSTDAAAGDGASVVASGDSAPVVASGDSASVIGCASAGALMYLLTDTGVLHTFDPALLPSNPDGGALPAGNFGTVGTVQCTFADGTTSVPTGDLAVDETGGLWANDATGHLERVDPTDATCTGTAFDPGPTGFTNMGMTFVGQPDGGETLYVVDNSLGPLSTAGRGLATIDPTTFQFALVGNFGAPLAGRVAELAGTASGHLYGFFLGAEVPSWFAEMDPASGALISSTELPVSISGVGQTHVTTAAALWGNVLYFFITNTSNAPSGDVFTYDIGTGATTQVLSQIGFNVTGAAIRACAATMASD